MEDLTLSVGVTTVLLLLLVIVLILMVWRIMTDRHNELECWQFIATKGIDGKHYADIDKLGKVVGMFVGSWAVVKVASSSPTDLTGFSLVLGTYFTFVGAVAGYGAYLRSKRKESEDESRNS